MRTVRIAVALAAVAALAAAPAHGRSPEARLRTALAKQMKQAGKNSGAYVQDVTTGRVLYQRRARTLRTLGSVNKLHSVATALLRLGPETTFDTIVRGAGTRDSAGVFHGDIYLVGAGDPTLDGTDLPALQKALQTAGITALDGRLRGDGTALDELRGTRATGYKPDPDINGLLGALVYDRAIEGRFYVKEDPAAHAARRLATGLTDRGFPATPGEPAAAPKDALELGRIPAPPLRILARRTLAPSNTFNAEMITKVLGARLGGAGSTAAGLTVIKQTLTDRFKVTPELIDGSGLAYGNRNTPQGLVRLLARIANRPAGKVLYSALALAGRSGTLAERMKDTPAEGRCRAKTGTLPAISALAGYCKARNGHRLAFAFLMNEVLVTKARVWQNNMAVALARYR